MLKSFLITAIQNEMFNSITMFPFKISEAKLFLNSETDFLILQKYFESIKWN